MVVLHSPQYEILTCKLQRFAWSHYLCKPATLKTFKSDYSRFRFLNVNLTKEFGDPKLCINHLIILFNTFEHMACLFLLFEIVSSHNFSKLKTYLLFISMLPPIIPHSGINTLDIPLDGNLYKILEGLQ